MGLFGGGKGGGLFGNFDPNRLAVAQALVAGDYGAAASILAGIRRERAAQDQAKAEALAVQDAEGRRAEALAQLGLGKPQINAIRPQDMSRLMFERFGGQPGRIAGILDGEAGLGLEATGAGSGAGGEGSTDRYRGSSAPDAGWGLTPGAMVYGHRYRGGDPHERRSWDWAGSNGFGFSPFREIP